MLEARLTTANSETIAPTHLDERFLLYVGPINATAIHSFDEIGNRFAHDQHSIIVHRTDKADIDHWEEGTLKVYCPSILPAFPPGSDLKKLNSLLFRAEPLLYQDIPLMDAIAQTATPIDVEYFRWRLEEYIRTNQNTHKLARKALSDNFQAFDRSIKLQQMFIEEDHMENMGLSDIKTQAIYTLARQKAIFIAMAPHYAIEAIYDDQFAGFPYHLPDHVFARLNENAPWLDQQTFDRRMFERGMHNSLFGAPSPDMYRFNPILATLIAPHVMTKRGKFYHYDCWIDFQKRVINHITDPVTVKAMEFFAKGMGIPTEYAYFAAYKMCQKELRKRGIDRISRLEETKREALHMEEQFKEDLDYFNAKDPYMRLSYYEENPGGLVDGRGQLLSRERFIKYREALEDWLAIEHVNSVIGTYKFIPWKREDRNFFGTFLPYSVMKSEKARIIDVLCSKEFLPYWKEEGNWFRDILPQLMESHPSMYSKWFIPLLEKGMIDTDIINLASQITIKYLDELAVWEDSQTPKVI